MDFITQRFIQLSHRITTALRDLRGDVQQLIRTIRNQQEADRQEHERWNDAPERIIRAEHKIQENSQREQRTYNNLHLWVQVLLAAGTWLAFLAAAIYAGVAAYQLREMTRAADAAGSAATAAIQANKDAGDRFRQDERPYVWLTNNLGSPEAATAPGAKSEDGVYVTWTWHYTNYGKTPAYNVRFSGTMYAEDNAITKSRILEHSKPAAPIPPNKDDFSTAFRQSRVTAQEFQRLMNTENSIVVFGRFNYTDAYGWPYETGFCFYHLRTGAIAYCPNPKENYIK